MSDSSGMDNELLLGRNVGFLVDVEKRKSRKEFAAAIGTTVTNVGLLINGKNKALRPISLVKAARALDVSVEQLVLEDIRVSVARGLHAPAMRVGTAETVAQPYRAHWTASEAQIIEEAESAWRKLIDTGNREALRIARMVVALLT